MGRPLRIDAPGCWHNLSHTAAAGRLAFRDEEDFRQFWSLFGEVEARFGLEVHTLVLMSTHWHAVVRSRDGRLSAAMQRTLSIYTKWFNRKYGINGALFRGRFWSEAIEDSAHLRNEIRYQHANPLDIKGVDRPEDYRWSSCATHAGLRSGPSWIRRHGVAFALRHDTRLAKPSTRNRGSSAAARLRPARVPAEVVAAAIERWARSAQVFIPRFPKTTATLSRPPN